MTEKAFMEYKGIAELPIVTTEFAGNNSATSVSMKGQVFDDGGAEITTRGIALATIYNPGINDQTESSGSGTGEFTVDVNGLTEGTTYYARTYATNSVGTAYGNCISFTANEGVGMEEMETFENELNIYPNPSSGITTIDFLVEAPGSMVIQIIDLKGQLVYFRDLGSLSQGENLMHLDLSILHSGIYNFQLKNNEKIVATRKLIMIQ